MARRWAAAAAAGGPVLVDHDADHRAPAVLADLRAYGPLVTEGSYLIVEDTNIGDVQLQELPGPREALADFLAESSGWQVDMRREKFRLTTNPGGYLRKRANVP